MTNTINLKQSEKNARLREIEDSKILSEEEMYLANELQAKANSHGMKLVPERKVKNKAKFAQIIQENWLYLIQNNYLKNEEIMFLNKIIGFIGFRSNCIVHDINTKEQLPMTQTEIAEKIGSSKNTVSRLIKQLIEKGLIGRFESGRDGINARMYALYINPNVILCGDRDNINQTLQTMFVRKPKELKKLPIKLV
ncbi:MarR family winged helix-turn-helix transcriptional regulator [Bacillus mycoides]|uniref:MarR family winged helix-turn-helix transcriptional regulator n=1 Tax=Bacillus mycoides TaxID=1405 RepID=UPI00292FDB4E|nr:MarR family transcriptional regulator [Bacillus mycoides]WOA61077.1 MarR family transcriptional regulator [Bacillus mycoides]